MTTPTRSRATALAVAALAGALLVASTAWACTAFLGTFEVTGDGGGTVKAIGKDNFDKNDASNTTFTMSQDIEGRTEATSGATGGGDAGWFEVSTTKSKATNSKLPATNSEHPYRDRLVGKYRINYLNGPAYATHDQWTLDCMSYTVEETTRAIELGRVTVLDSGKIEGQPVGFDIPAQTTADEVGESGVCISDEGGWFGNQAPITML